MRTLTTTIGTTLIAAALAACGGHDDNAGTALPALDFAVADLETLSFAAKDVPSMEYQRQRSGLGAFTNQEENVGVAARLEKIGLEANYVSQFFATSGDSELLFVESLVFLFEDEPAAAYAVDKVKREDLDNLSPSAEIDAPDLGEQPFGIKGDFDGYTTYSYGWRVGDAVQLLTVAPNGDSPSPDRTLELAHQLAALAEGVDQSSATLDRAAYLRQATAICAHDGIDEAAQEFFAGFSRENPPTSAKYAEFVNEVVIPTHRAAEGAADYGLKSCAI